MSRQKKNIIAFALLTLGLMVIASGIFKLCGGVYASTAGMVFAAGCMMIPLVSVIISQLIQHEEPLRGCGISWKINKWWFIGWLLMPVLSVVGTIISGYLPGETITLDILQAAADQVNAAPGVSESGMAFTPKLMLIITLVSGLFAGITSNALFAFGEEIGWRGWLLNQFYNAPLCRHKTFWRASIMTGIIWGIWHAPLILMGHNYPQHPVAGVFMMVLFCVSFSPIITYLRLRSGSVIVAAIVHGTLNAFAGLTLMLVQPQNDLLIGMAGAVGIAVFIIIDLLILWYQKSEKKKRLLQ